jgi:type I restriction enzyme S subunit
MDANKIRIIRIIRGNPRFRHYPEYKESGVEWIGEIPKHCEMKRLKYVADLNMGQSPPSEEYNSDQIGTPFLQGNAEFGMHHPTPKIYCPTAKKHASPSDILVSVRAPVGALNIADQEYGIGRGLCAIRPRMNQLERHYAKYLLEVVRTELHVVATGSTYDAVTVDEVSNLTCVVPSFSEQIQIANFLDRKTEQIDELIRIKERRIELLQAQRTALINQAVTKGLDPNVEMKPSGVEWIGEIPAHWEVIPIKHTLQIAKDSIRTGPFGSSLKSHEFQDKGIRVYNQQSVYNEDFSKSDVFISEEKFNELRSFIVQPKDVLITSRGTIGKMTIVPKNGEIGVLHPCLIRLRLNENKLIPKYLWWYVNHSSFFIESVKIASNSTTIDVIYSETLSSVKIPIPTVKEQLAILEFLNVKIPIIDTTISNERKKIELLKEYRQSLISEAVTGKIDVRDEV